MAKKTTKKPASKASSKPTPKAAAKSGKSGVLKKSSAKLSPKRTAKLKPKPKASRVKMFTKPVAKATSKPLAKRSTKKVIKKAAKKASKQVSKQAGTKVARKATLAAAKPAAPKSASRSRPPQLEVEISDKPLLAPIPTHKQRSKSKRVEPSDYQDDVSDYDDFDADGSSGTLESPEPLTRDDMLTSASAKQAAAMRHLRENDPTYAAGVVDARTFAINAARLLHDDNCDDIAVLDIKALGQVCDYIVIGSGTSDRQMKGVAKNVEHLGEKQGYNPYRKHADERSTWLLADFVDVVVHLFEPNTRELYDLEMMWADAPRVAWERPDQVDRNRAGLNA